KIISIFSILFCLELNAQNIDSKTLKKIDSYIENIQNKVDIPAISIGIIKNDNLIYKKSYSRNKNITPDSLFYIGSLTKSFTALAIIQLIEDRKINLDDSIKKYLPWFEIKDMKNVDNITIRTLLNQTSGFSTYDGLKNFDDWDSSDFALEKTIRALKNIFLVSEPSTTFHYSNINYQILGLIIEKVTKLSYNEYVKDNIFTKLDMKGSFASVDNLDKENITQGHRLWFGQAVKSNFPFSRVMLPAGYIISNVEDISKYLIAQLNNGKYKKEQIFSPTIIKQVQTPSATIIKDDMHYGFGWFVDTSEELYLSHTGSTPGYTSAMVIYPEEKLGIVVLTNITSYTLGSKELNSLAGGIIDIIKNKEIKKSEIDIVLISGYLFLFGLLIVQLFVIKSFIKKFKDISKNKITLSFIFDILVVLLFFIVVPKISDLTFSGFLLFVPDIGYLMLGSIFIAILGFIIKIILKLRVG
ncbi:MAG: beta-lactamase family protein, partial [Arcobacter sp.]|nr:beta-lactamase family protein [Arcobacter sp.]